MSAGPFRLVWWKPQTSGVSLGSLRLAALHLALGDPGRLTATLAQVVELGATDDAAALHLDGLDVRRQDREHPLHAFAEADLADGEVLLQAAAGAGDADALEGLDALALAFLDAHVDAHGVAGLELRGLADGLEAVGLFALQGLDHVHRLSPLKSLTVTGLQPPFTC